MMIGRVFAVVLMVVVPAYAWATTADPIECIEQKATAIVERGINVADVPIVARMIAEDMCLHTMQPVIDLLKAGYGAESQDEPRQLSIQNLSERARKALLKEMGLAD